MTTNEERAADVLWNEGAYCGQCGWTENQDAKPCPDCETILARYARALASAGLLAPEPQIIRTIEELEALDPETLLMPGHGNSVLDLVVMAQTDWLSDHQIEPRYIFPLAVIATGEQVRAAHTVLQETTHE